MGETATSLRDCYNSLREDEWRKSHPFPRDIVTVNEILFNPFSKPAQREEAITLWLAKWQPCLFGRIAAAQKRLHCCVITQDDILSKSDVEIAYQIQDSLLSWKRRSLDPRVSDPAHGFVLVVSGQRIAYAAPDDRLLAFATRIRDLWNPPASQEESGHLHWETLFLTRPDRSEVRKFSFTIDWFGTQGDQRWWHDHRAPAGMLFTANSIGHMQWYREWYEGKQDQQEWTLQTAMLTIKEAATTEYGKATELLPLSPGDQPFLREIKCPVHEDKLKPVLKGFDWTRYAGFLHTDHSIRPEFFQLQPEPPPEEYLQDFSYLYSPMEKDYERFVSGVPASEEEITEMLGPKNKWQRIRNRIHRARNVRSLIGSVGSIISPRSLEQEQGEMRVQALLQEARQWQMSAEQIRDLS